jgi:hypothetical protein
MSSAPIPETQGRSVSDEKSQQGTSWRKISFALIDLQKDEQTAEFVLSPGTVGLRNAPQSCPAIATASSFFCLGVPAPSRK